MEILGNKSKYRQALFILAALLFSGIYQPLATAFCAPEDACCEDQSASDECPESQDDNCPPLCHGCSLSCVHGFAQALQADTKINVQPIASSLRVTFVDKPYDGPSPRDIFYPPRT